jgi:hypothetical protein
LKEVPDIERQVQDFIELAEAEKNGNRFIIGAFAGGITLYKQQVRALNLLYAIHHLKRLPEKARIAVIGGGVSGITATAAAITLGYEVYLFESRPLLLHLQHGCDTRWVHPHLYDWPEPGSDRPYAELPLLNWREGTAADVAEQIEKGFKQLRSKPEVERVSLHTGAKIRFEEPLRVSWTSSLEDPQSGAESFNAIIFAVGFGVELQVDKKLTLSYWRNDSWNQPEPGASVDKKSRFFISGTGDGALIDLLRARIESFNQGRILRELIDRSDAQLISELKRIKAEWGQETRGKKSHWLFDEYNKLFDAGLVTNLRNRLKARLRKDTEAILNGKSPSLSYALRLDSASLFNTLLVHNLKALDAFKYEPGECNPYGKSGVKIKGKVFRKAELNMVIRHGTDRIAVFKAAKVDKEAETLRAKYSSKPLDTSKRLWPAGWWDQTATALGNERREFVPPPTIAITTTFVSTLSDIIKLLHRSTLNLQFRATLHRLINVQGEDYFQQVSRYSGTRTEGAVGRVFEVTGGLGGLACRVGRPVIIRRDKDWTAVWEHLHLGKLAANSIHESVLSLLACPFFAPTGASGKPTHVALLLFMDSAQNDFFNEQVLENVYAACRGFVQNLETMREKAEVVFLSSDYIGYKYTEPQSDLDFIEKYESVKADHKVFERFIQDLTFKTVKSLDIDLDTLEGQDGKNVIPS